MVKNYLIKGKKAQLKIQQMMFMLLAITLLFSLIGIFFLSISFSQLKKTSETTEINNALLLVSKLAKSPEFSCGNSFGSVNPNCVDFDKVIWLLDRETEYSKFWGVARIEIKKIYPKDLTPCDSSNYPNCGVLTILNRSVKTLPASSNFITLCRKESINRSVYDKCELAKLIVSGEDKT